MKKIIFAFVVFTLFGFIGCSSSNNYKEQSVALNEVKKTPLPTNTPIPTLTNTPVPTPISTINDVEIYFDKNLVTFTSREEAETVYLTVDLNGYMGDFDFEYDVTGYGNVNIVAGKAEVEPGKFKLPLHISPVENCTLILTYKIKETYESTDITIVTNFFD